MNKTEYSFYRKFIVICISLHSYVKRWFDVNRAYILLNMWSVSVGKDLRVRGRLKIRNWGQLDIGNNVRMKSGYEENPVGNANKLTLWTFPGGSIHIENDVGISNSTIVARSNIFIGEGTNIGGGCAIFDNDFHVLGKGSFINSKPISIGKNCFIGGYSIILKGVVIGDGSIVGAGSVVTKSIPSLEVWAGNPARFIRLI